MTQQTLTIIRQDQKPTTTKLTTRDVFSIWLADQDKLIRTVYEAAVWRGLRQDNPAAGLKAPKDKMERSKRIKFLPLDG